MLNNRDVLVIGVGNEFRSDDAAGLMAAGRIKNKVIKGVEVIESDGDGSEMIEMWTGHENVIIIDAVSSGSKPGTIHRVVPEKDPESLELFRFSTHTFSIPQAVKLAASINNLPRKLIVFGVEGSRFEYGDSISPDVTNAMPIIESLVEQES